MQLNFAPDKFPRTIARYQWKQLWRWKRMTEKRLAAALAAVSPLQVDHGARL